jgi:2-dehydro-3-deoxy-D-arabinonate dehydratase
MLLTRHADPTGFRWALDGLLLPRGVTLGTLLNMRREAAIRTLQALPAEVMALGRLLSPIEPTQEVWASGVTYLRSRVEREAESSVADVYAKVYEAERPELFFKSLGWRVIGEQGQINIRNDSAWNVPEPELTLVLNRYMEVFGYTAGNDMSSRSIEGENPLYLPQAKMYDGACALGPAIAIAPESSLIDCPINLSILRGDQEVFSGDASTSQMKRKFADLTEHLGRETTFPFGVFLMTGTGIVPSPNFTLQPGDRVKVSVGDLILENPVGHGREGALEVFDDHV